MKTLRSLFLLLLPLGLGVALTGCVHVGRHRHDTVADVLRDYRGSSDWNASREAYREIMSQYVHGAGIELDEAELDADFEAFLTLERGEVEAFVASQSCVPETSAEPTTYYVANASHERHDANYAAAPTHPLTGAGPGTQTLHATFSASMLLARQTVDANTEFPPRARNAATNPFKTWADVVDALTNRAQFDRLFHFVAPADGHASQADRVFDATHAVDWSRGSAELFMAPEIDGGAFSPALFAVLLLRTEPNARPTVYLTVAADAGGHAQPHPYVGLIADPVDPAYHSTTQFAFTYLSDAGNLLDHAVVLRDANTLAFELWITTGFPGPLAQPGPYLTVRTSVTPTASDAAASPLRAGRAARVLMMLRKGALMRDLIAAYYPRWPQLRLWSAVGALSNSRRFRRRLEAAGLTLAASLVEYRLWLERPAVRPTGPGTEPAFAAHVDALLPRCGVATP